LSIDWRASRCPALKLDLNKLPFDPFEYIKHFDELPFGRDLDPGLGQ